MRLKFVAALIFVVSVSTFASATSAQSSVQSSQSVESAQAQQQMPTPPPFGQRPMGQSTMGGGTMGRGSRQMAGPMGSANSTIARSQGPGMLEPLQMVFKLVGALDDPRTRTMLGISDQQADSLHKVVLDTETFTITTAAAIAVNTLELNELLRADKPDRTAVMGKGDEISKSTSDLISHYLDAVLAAKQILTPEQQKMIRTYMENGAPTPPLPPAIPIPPAHR